MATTTNRTKPATRTAATGRSTAPAKTAKAKLKGLTPTTRAKKPASAAGAGARRLVAKPAARPEAITIEIPAGGVLSSRPFMPASPPTGTIDGAPQLMARVGSREAWAQLGENLRFYNDISEAAVRDVKRDVARMLQLELTPEQFTVTAGFPVIEVNVKLDRFSSATIKLDLETGETAWRTGGFVEKFPLDEGARKFAENYHLKWEGQAADPVHARPAGGGNFFDAPVHSQPRLGTPGWFGDFQKTLDNQQKLYGDPAIASLRAVLPKLDEHFSAATGRQVQVTIGDKVGQSRGADAGGSYQVKVSVNGGAFKICQGRLYLGDANSHIGAPARKLAGDIYKAVQKELGAG